MAKNISERCLVGLKCIEEQLRDASMTLEALNSLVNTNVFMSNNNIPSNIDDLILLDTVLTYFNSHKDEQVKRGVFNFLFDQKNDLRKMDFLVKLTSLSVATLSPGALDVISSWIKTTTVPKQILEILIRRLLTDILSIDENRNNLLRSIPEASISFTVAFLIGLTDTYQFIDIGSQKPHVHPSLGLLKHVLQWVQKYKTQLFNQSVLTIQTANLGTAEENKNTPFSGLLFWTLSHPLGKISDENISEDFVKENELISILHFELIDYMDSLIKGSNPSLLSIDYLKSVVETIRRFEVPQTPLSPQHGREDQVEPVKVEVDKDSKNLDLVLIRLSGVLQIGMENECLQCSTNELVAIFKDLRSHRYIDAVLKRFE